MPDSDPAIARIEDALTKIGQDHEPPDGCEECITGEVSEAKAPVRAFTDEDTLPGVDDEFDFGGEQ